MRDPQARLVFTADHVFRHLTEVLPANHVLTSGAAQKWVDLQLLVPFECINKNALQSPRLPFVSSPEEWCNAQLYAAAELTLSLLERANAEATDLKDASAWNVIFDGCKPLFCDLTSFVHLETKTWWAAGQFVRHFISPLWLAAETGFQARDIFRMSRDGAMPELVQQTLGWRRFLSRCWPLVASSKATAVAPTKPVANSLEEIQAFRKSLLASLRWMLKGVEPRDAKETVWSDYTEQRAHYATHALDVKRQQVSRWLDQLKPTWTLDMGCNSGEFTQLARDVGSQVIAVDGDHDAVQALYRKHAGNSGVYPVVAALDDIHSGRGWAGNEHAGLAQRLEGSADLVMMLALIHHLSIASSIHLEEVARFAAKCTRCWLIVELLEPHDPQVVLLCSQRQRKPSEFSIELQRQSFINAGFTVTQTESLPGGHRHLVLLTKN
jgi:SAM-dependent methyltransferase